MKYTVMQACQKLGVTRRMLRFIEEKKLMDKKSYENKNNRYREYDEDDLDRIWVIKLLQGMGFSFDEIVEMTKNPNFDWFGALANKIESMEEEKRAVEKRIGYAKAMKLLGIIPYGPKEKGSMTVKEYLESSMQRLNTEINPEMDLMYDYIEQQKREQKMREESILEMNLFDPKLGVIITYHYIEIVEKMDLGYIHPEVQEKVKKIYGIMHEIFLEKLDDDVSPKRFARNVMSQFFGADIAYQNKLLFGERGCEFLANAIAYFGGYANYEEIE